ncbi:MAG TPA: TIGR04053 family radical SAM/SPASM domain-containing protein [Candidatus Binatia bacterium]|jgi:radical SAM protein
MTESPTPGPRPAAPRAAFDRGPIVAFYEATQACDLVCTHCRACAQPKRSARELSAGESKLLLEDLRRFAVPPLVVLTGGDPMKRPDIFDLVAHGTGIGLSMAMTPSATPLVTRQALRRLAECGLARLAVSIDGAGAASHDGLRGVPGSFARSLEILRDAREYGLSLQVNTTVHSGNAGELSQLAALLDGYSIALWSVFFLVPVGRAAADARIRPAEYETIFALLERESAWHKYAIKTTEAPHYRRFVMQKHEKKTAAGAAAPGDGLDRSIPAMSPSSTMSFMSAPGMAGTNDGNGVVFIGHTGLIHPSGFLPLACGRFPERSVVDVYQQHGLMKALRDCDHFAGKCGVCDYRHVCGGSRARSFALTGDAFGSDPDCVYQPPAWKQMRAATLAAARAASANEAPPSAPPFDEPSPPTGRP